MALAGVKGEDNAGPLGPLPPASPGWPARRTRRVGDLPCEPDPSLVGLARWWGLAFWQRRIASKRPCVELKLSGERVPAADGSPRARRADDPPAP